MSTALYRRYRPETFADVIGQEHVTEPLMAALRGDRVTHAYLFSGPRGCGKTTSARIFARCLNCEQGPTDTPCGVCDSCVDLARGGAGSLDVVEMDAASHGGVEDARDLRERAAFAPVRDRFKIFIIDEAHMVSNQGFNALLKLVEEPPKHVKFVFATTEPEKVIGTIRSRTHHYPFRLVPPERLQSYLEQLCEAEGVRVAGGVLPLVVRAGGGSVRDSLSVLDQLIAGAEDGAVSYERAIALLGYTDATLLDDVVEAIAARDGASVFRVVDRVIESGHDPRRFVEDLLERLRDLVVIAVAGERAGSVLRAVPEDQLGRMRTQAQHLGAAQLSRAADLVNEALTEMTGATSPRLQLELLCARILLPGADDGARGHGARLERIERHLSSGAGAGARAPAGVAAGAGGDVPAGTDEGRGRGDVPAGTRAANAATAAGYVAARAPGASADSGAGDRRGDVPAGTPDAGAGSAPDDRRRNVPAGTPGAGAGSAPDDRRRNVPAGTPGAGAGSAPDDRRRKVPAETRDGEGARESAPAGARGDVPAGTRREGGGAGGDVPAGTSDAGSRPQSAPARGERATNAERTPSAPAPAAEVDADMVRRRWPEVLETLARLKRSTWALVSQNGQVAEIGGGVLRLAFATSGLAQTFRSGPHVEPLQRALAETLGVQVRIEAVLSQGASDGPDANPYAPTSRSGRQGAGDPRGAGEPPAGPMPATSWEPAPEPDWDPAAVDPGPEDDAGAAAAPRPGAPTDHRAGPDGPRPAMSGDRPQPDSGDGARGGVRPDAGRGATPPGVRGAGADQNRDARDRNATTDGPADRGPRGGDASEGGARGGEDPSASVSEDLPSMDDPDAEDSGLVGAPLVARLLGGTVIDEQHDRPPGAP